MREKIIDCIFFEKSLKILNFRISESVEQVDFIYIFFYGEDKKYELNSEDFLFKKNNKIKLVEYSSFLGDKFFKARKHLLDEDMNFDNIILISNENELPNYEEFSPIIELLPFSPVVLLQKKYTWSLDYLDNSLHEGTIVCYFSSFFKYDNLEESFLEKNPSNKIFEIYENGWSFFGFDIIDSQLKSNLLPYHETYKFKTKMLIKSKEIEKVKNIYNFIEKSEINLRDKKIFYIGDVESDILFDERMIFSKTNNLCFESDFNQIYIPNYQLYDSNNFELEYFLNEVVKYMSILFPLPHDEIIFNFKFMNESKKILWGHLETGNLLELLLN